MPATTDRRQRKPKKTGKTKGARPAPAKSPAVADKRPAARSERTAPRSDAAPTRSKPKMRASPPPVDLEVEQEVLEFIKAIEDYRITHDRPFPSWSEVLYVLKRLGYEKVRPAGSDAPAGR